MADRQVTQTGKDRDADITALCGWWGRAPKAAAIFHIETGTHTYFVQDSYNRRGVVQVVNGRTGKYLRSDPNSSCSDNLGSLPNC